MSQTYRFMLTEPDADVLSRVSRLLISSVQQERLAAVLIPETESSITVWGKDDATVKHEVRNATHVLGEAWTLTRVNPGAVPFEIDRQDKPTGDQSWCDVNQHQWCDGWCTNHADPELCECECHDEQAEMMTDGR